MQETNYLDGMEKRLFIIAGLTMGVFMLTVFLFIVIVNLKPSDPISTSVIPAAPQEKAIDHPGQKIFNANCTPCHRMHQKLIGPPLAGVLERRDSLWVIKMIRNSSQLIASGDAAAAQLFRGYNGIQMTSFTSFSDEDLRTLLEYIKLETKREEQPVPTPGNMPASG